MATANVSGIPGAAFLCRKHYDLLVTDHQDWMATHWLSLDRHWTIDGVLVTGPVERISEIAAFIRSSSSS